MSGTESGIEQVGVAGCGLMGRGIAEVCALAGYRTVVREVEQGLLDRGIEAIGRSLDKSVEKGRLEPTAAAAARTRIEGTLEVARLASSDLVIEAIVENLDAKRALFQELDAQAPAGTLFASNTSSLTLTQLAATTARGDRFVGLHFFNPVPAMRLVEVVGTLLTSEESLARGRQFVTSLGKIPVACKDNSGFIVNRLLVPYLLDAVRALEGGVGSVEDIDVAMKLGCGYPMGPFTLLDFIGLDTVLFIADIMFEEYRETRFAPPPLLKQMVQAGRLGRKSGRGFYPYD
jgi:3-hydroxybutyryl-CoA dehydrogenase